MSKTTTSLSSAEILGIPSNRPELLFKGDAKTIRDAFTSLVKRWHPDRSGGSAEVFEKVIALHQSALAATESPATAVVVKDSSGRSFSLAYKIKRPFELGEFTVSNTKLGFLVNRNHHALFENGIKTLTSIRYQDEKVRAQMERFFPKPRGIYTTAEADVAVFDKTEDVIVLSDLIAHMGGAIPPKHTAWVVSSLLNLACFLEVSGLTCNAITPENILVTPKHHAAYTTSWWYAMRAGERLSILPPATFDLVPPEMARSKKASIKLDLESVRAIGRACLGDPSGASLAARADVPRSVSDFLRLPAADSAIADYRTWLERALPGFGPRRFLKLEITSNDVYR